MKRKPKQVVTVRLAPDLIRSLKAIARRERVTLSDLIVGALATEVQRSKAQAGAVTHRD